MAHVHYIPKPLHSELSWRNRETTRVDICFDCPKTLKNDQAPIYKTTRKSVLERERERTLVSKYSSSSIPSAEALELGRGGGKNARDGKYGEQEGQFGRLVSESGWAVRRIVEDGDEMRRVADIQAEAFHVPVFFFNDLFFEFFKAEVLSGLLYRLRNSPQDRYACLVAEPASHISLESELLVGVVDAMVLRDKSVLRYLPGVEEYLYVSGTAVLRNFRRKKVATVLLRACEVVATIWGFEYLVLRAYEDDWGARRLYENAGYRVVSGDPHWKTSWIGKRRRILMIKRSWSSLE